MTSQAGQQIITIQILSNISRSKVNNEIWSVNEILREKFFSSKIIQKMGQEDSLFQISFCLFF